MRVQTDFRLDKALLRGVTNKRSKYRIREKRNLKIINVTLRLCTHFYNLTKKSDNDISYNDKTKYIDIIIVTRNGKTASCDFDIIYRFSATMYIRCKYGHSFYIVL